MTHDIIIQSYVWLPFLQRYLKPFGRQGNQKFGQRLFFQIRHLTNVAIQKQAEDLPCTKAGNQFEPICCAHMFPVTGEFNADFIDLIS